MSTENNATVNINQNPVVSRMVSNVTTQLESSKGKAENTSAAFTEETKTASSTLLGFTFNSILSALTIFRDVGLGIFIAFFSMIKEVFNDNATLVIVAGVILTIIIGSILLAIWSTIRAGR